MEVSKPVGYVSVIALALVAIGFSCDWHCIY